MGIKGAILGDIAGSRFERYPIFRHEYFPSLLKDQNLNGEKEYEVFTNTSRFTDDTVMSIATMKAFHSDKNYAKAYREMYSRYPGAGYGKAFKEWAQNSNANAYGSFGNGSAMRVSYIGESMKNNPFKFMVEIEARKTAIVSHSHPEGIKGAITVAVCVWMAERGKNKEDIQKYLYNQYPHRKYEIKQFECLTTQEGIERRKAIEFSSKSQDTVPLAVHSFLQTDNFFDCMSLINSMECDTDTIGAIAGAICESYYGKCTKFDNEIIKAYLTLDLQKDLGSCGINLSTTSNKEWMKHHDMVEELYYQEAMEAAAMEAYMMDVDNYEPRKGNECDGQITLDEFFSFLENPDPENESFVENEYYQMLTKEIKDFDACSSEMESVTEILNTIESNDAYHTSEEEDIDHAD